MTALTNALTALGYTAASDQADASQQVALIETLYLAGYLSRENIWNSLHQMEGPFGNDELSPAEVFARIDLTLAATGAYQDDPDEFEASVLIEQLANEDTLDEQDAVDFVTYLHQTAFDRKFGEERNALKQHNWMTTHSDTLKQHIRTLGLQGEVRPDRDIFEYSLILGAARLRGNTRTRDFRELCENGADPGNIYVLAGNRELSAELDGIGDTPSSKKIDGITYMFNICAQEGIELAPNNALRTNESGTATYVNYADDTQPRLTETLMMNDQVKTILGDTGLRYHLVDTHDDTGYRPTTASTAADTFKSIVEDLDPEDSMPIHILVQSNQPYVERQRLTIENTFRKLQEDEGLEHVNFVFHGNGEANEVGLAPTLSALAALGAERYKSLTGDQSRKRDSETLMCQTRNKSTTHIPQLPTQGGPDLGHTPQPPHHRL